MRTKKITSKSLPNKYKKRSASPNEIDSYLTIDGMAYKDPRLKDFNIKALYARIKMYCNLKPGASCFATVKTLSKFIGKSPAWVSSKIALLIKLEYIYEENIDGARHLKIRHPPSKNSTPHTILPSILKSKVKNSIYTGNADPNIRQRHLNLSSMLIKKQTTNHPKLMKTTPMTKVKGATEISKLERLDKFDFKEIKATILWGIEDEFWKDKILSPAKLREVAKNGSTKFQNLYRSWQRSKSDSRGKYKRRPEGTYKNKADLKPQM